MPQKKRQTADALRTAAEAIGTTLGKLAVKTGLATPPAAIARKRKKASPAGKSTVNSKTWVTAAKRSKTAGKSIR